MSQALEAALQEVSDRQRIADLAATDAEMRLEEERIAADLLRNVNKGPRLAAENIRHAVELQVLTQDARKRAGWI